jgi:tRNA (guanine26-N2/guanine27-N2)-dimethyltransferase
MGVRILLGALARSGARFDAGIRPLFTYAKSHYVRTFCELDRRASDADAALEHLGFLYHCEDCLYRESERALTASPPSSCPNCSGARLLTAGPVWCGPVRDPAFVEDVTAAVPDSFGTAAEARGMLEQVRAELQTPTHYDQHKLCKHWGLPANAMDEFLTAIRDAGYETSRTHYGGTTFKTDADVGAIRAATEPLLES